MSESKATSSSTSAVNYNDCTAKAHEKNGTLDKSNEEWKKLLTAQEYAILREKDTERAGVGEYTKFHQEGTFVCRACKTPLYESDHKFDSSCGWPAFWGNLPKTVREVPETDGSRRVEIVCNAF